MKNKYELKGKKIVGSELSRLERKVLSIVNEDADGDPIPFLNDVISHGCISGMIGELIYYSDTIAWFKKYRDEIEEKLTECKREFGNDFQLNGWLDDDPFARETQNQNLLAWFSFETVCYEIQNQLEG